MEKKLILFLSANPDDPDYDRLHLIEECNDVADKIKSAKHGNEADFRERHEISVKRIQEIIADTNPQIVHFTGHGEKEHLVLEGINEQTEQAKAEALANMFRILNKRKSLAEENKILCVVLSACYSSWIAKSVAEHVDFVVGMSNEVGEDAGRIFAESFYYHLFSGESFGDAFEFAKNKIQLMGIPGQDIPKLEPPRKGIDPSTVFLFPPAPATVPRELLTVTKEEETPESTLLPDSTRIAKLSIDSDFLDQIYEQARTQAFRRYDDAEFSDFSISVYPFIKSANLKVTIYLRFYSKYADRVCTFVYHEDSGLEHLPPDYRAKMDYERNVFTKLPWKEAPHWREFLQRAFAKMGPLPPESKTHYMLWALSPPSWCAWQLRVYDGFSGDEHKFEWDGKGLDEHNIRQVN